MTCFLLCALCALPAGRITHGGDTVSFTEMVDDLSRHEVVFIGEKHDDPLAHQWEMAIWSALAEEGRTLALEMFETDVQEALNSYLSGETGRREFLEVSRPWNNYSEDYSPMVELALELGLPVIAANVPRRYAAMVASGGWQSVAEEPFFQELSIDSSSTLYRERFMATMEAMGGQMHGMPMDHGNMYRAQLLKDAVMAASIQGISCVFICGSFHSDYHSGIPDQLSCGVSQVTVKILPGGESLDPEAADYVIVRE